MKKRDLVFLTGGAMAYGFNYIVGLETQYIPMALLAIYFGVLIERRNYRKK